MERFFCKFFIYCLIFFASTAQATYQIDKVRLLLSDAQLVDTIHLTNSAVDDQTVNLQINSYHWEQKEGTDVYTPTSDLIISPPIIKIKPKKTQILRVGLRKSQNLNIEDAYRIYIQEITPRQPGRMGVQFKINLGIPVFVEPQHPVYNAKFELQKTSDKALKLMIKNTGNMHLQIINIILSNSMHQKVAESKTPFYLLPTNQKVILLTAKINAEDKYILDIDTDHDHINQEIRIQ